MKRLCFQTVGSNDVSEGLPRFIFIILYFFFFSIQVYFK